MAIIGYEEIINAGTASALPAFALLITEANISEGASSDFWTDVDVDGHYIRIATANDGSGRLPFEVVVFDKGTKTFLIWLRTSLGTSANTLYITLDDSLSAFPGVDDVLGRNAVWADELTVLHFEDTGNSTGGGGVTLLNGATLVGGSMDFSGGSEGSSATDRATLPIILAGQTAARMSLVCEFDNSSAWAAVFTQSSTGLAPFSWGVWRRGDNNEIHVAIATTDGLASFYSSGASVTVGGPYQIDVDYDGSNVRIYIDGVLRGSAALTGALLDTGTNTAYFGVKINNYNPMNGRILDFSFSDNLSRSADWIAAANDNRTDPAIFFAGQGYTAAGTEESLDIGEAGHGLSSDISGFLQFQDIVISDVHHPLFSEGGTFSVAGSLSVNGAFQAQGTDIVSLAQFLTLKGAGAGHVLLSSLAGLSPGNVLDPGQDIIFLTSMTAGFVHFQDILPGDLLHEMMCAQVVLNSGDLIPPENRFLSPSRRSRSMTPTTSRTFQPRT